MATSWRLKSECHGQEELFFQGGRAKNEALKICRRCTVREECLEFALSTPEMWGIWGGTTAKDRRAILRFRNQLNGTPLVNPRIHMKKKAQRTNFRIL
jgi:WhiB family redox-sensing transcriptional regulator